MADNDNGVSGFGWFLAGLGIGALVGVLYAPKAGRETREDIVSGALDARDKASVLAQEKAQQLQAKAQQLQEKAQQLQEKAQQIASDYVDRGKEYYERGRSQFNEYVERGKDLAQEHQDKLSAAIDAGKEAYTTTTSEPQS